MLEQAWRLSPSVALRPEPFGALAYHFGNRRLTFLKRPELVRVVRALAGEPTVRQALRVAGVPEEHWPAYLGALDRLAQADMIRPAGPPHTVEPPQTSGPPRTAASPGTGDTR